MCKLDKLKHIDNRLVMCNGCKKIFVLEDVEVLFANSENVIIYGNRVRVHRFEVRIRNWTCPLCKDWGWYVLVYCEENGDNTFPVKENLDNIRCVT